jgi:hypothetical protein
MAFGEVLCYGWLDSWSSRSHRYVLAAAHLELVLADDHAQVDQLDLALRSRLSAASCFWRAGQPDQAHELFETMIQNHPMQKQAIREVIAALEQDYPQPSSSPRCIRCLTDHYNGHLHLRCGDLYAQGVAKIRSSNR